MWLAMLRAGRLSLSCTMIIMFSWTTLLNPSVVANFCPCLTLSLIAKQNPVLRYSRLLDELLHELADLPANCQVPLLQGQGCILESSRKLSEFYYRFLHKANPYEKFENGGINSHTYHTELCEQRCGIRKFRHGFWFLSSWGFKFWATFGAKVFCLACFHFFALL